MIETLIVGFFAVLFGYLARFKETKWGLEIAFILLTIFVAIRYDWGNDYAGYLHHFSVITKYDVLDFDIIQMEPGWLYINYISKGIGFFGLTIFLTIFEYFVIYKLIKKYVAPKWYWLSILIWSFNTSFLLVTSSMMRQYVAITIFVIAVEYIVERKWIISLILIFLATLFHTSALILIPCAFLGYIDININKRKAYIFLITYIILYFFAVEIFGDYIKLLIATEKFERYETYLESEKTVVGSGLGVVFNMILLYLLVINQEFQKKNTKILFVLAIISFLFSVFGNIAPLIGRLGFYFSIYTVVCFPMMFHTMKNKMLRNIVIVLYLIILLKGFIEFFSEESIWYKAFYHYKTIFSSFYWK